jgi:hypothetical protein
LLQVDDKIQSLLQRVNLGVPAVVGAEGSAVLGHAEFVPLTGSADERGTAMVTGDD